MVFVEDTPVRTPRITYQVSVHETFGGISRGSFWRNLERGSREECFECPERILRGNPQVNPQRKYLEESTERTSKGISTRVPLWNSSRNGTPREVLHKEDLEESLERSPSITPGKKKPEWNIQSNLQKELLASSNGTPEEIFRKNSMGNPQARPLENP